MRRPPLVYLYAVTLTGILANTLLTPNIPDVLADLGQPDERAGILVAVGPLPGVVIAPIIGVLADRHGRRRVLLPCLVLFGVMGVAAAAAPSFGWLLLARLLQGFGSAGLINLVVVLIGDHWEGNERTTLIGRNAAVLTAGLALLPSISGLVAELASWRWSLGIASVGVPLAFLGTRMLEDTKPAEAPTIRDQLRGVGVAVRQPNVVGVLIAGTSLFVVIFGVFLTALPVHLEDEFDLGAGARGLVLSVPALGAVVASYNLGRMSSRFGRRATLTIGGAAVSVASLAMGLAPTVLLILVAGVLYGLGDGLGIPTLQEIAASATGPEQRGAVMAVWVSAARLGQAIGPIAASVLFTATSTSTTMIVGAAGFGLTTLYFWVGPFDDPTSAGAD